MLQYCSVQQPHTANWQLWQLGYFSKLVLINYKEDSLSVRCVQSWTWIGSIHGLDWVSKNKPMSNSGCASFKRYPAFGV